MFITVIVNFVTVYLFINILDSEAYFLNRLLNYCYILDTKYLLGVDHVSFYFVKEEKDEMSQVGVVSPAFMLCPFYLALALWATVS